MASRPFVLTCSPARIPQLLGSAQWYVDELHRAKINTSELHDKVNIVALHRKRLRVEALSPTVHLTLRGT